MAAAALCRILRSRPAPPPQLVAASADDVDYCFFPAPADARAAALHGSHTAEWREAVVDASARSAEAWAAMLNLPGGALRVRRVSGAEEEDWVAYEEELKQARDEAVSRAAMLGTLAVSHCIEASRADPSLRADAQAMAEAWARVCAQDAVAESVAEVGAAQPLVRVVSVLTHSSVANVN
jgi:hypothetical protein